MITVIDVETTGLDAATNSVVEFAAVQMSNLGVIKNWQSSLVKPKHKIEFAAMAAHHITEDMVCVAPELDYVLNAILGKQKSICYAAHNAAFDSAFLPASVSPWICTWGLSQHLWPEAPSHSNSALRYWLGLAIDVEDGPMALPPHRALPDAWVTAHIVKRMLAEKSIKDLMALSAKPILLNTVRFGEHRGKPWSQVPSGYLKWITGKDFDPDTIHTARHYLGR